MSRPIPDKVLRINEIFYSIQGESTQMGRPCVFVRLTYCNLRCTYCDTEYAFFEGHKMTLQEIVDQVDAFRCPLVQITGGEPMIQEPVLDLMTVLADRSYEVMLETAGHMPLHRVDRRVKKIMDIKCPGSGEAEKTDWNNLEALKPEDEIKFVVGDRVDFEFAVEMIRTHDLTARWQVLISPVFGRIDHADLAGWILDLHLPVRMQLQLHKYIWSPETRGV